MVFKIIVFAPSSSEITVFELDLDRIMLELCGSRRVKVVKFLGSWRPDGHSDCKFTMKMEVGRLGAPAADGLVEGCQDIQGEALEAPRRPPGSRG